MIKTLLTPAATCIINLHDFTTDLHTKPATARTIKLLATLAGSPAERLSFADTESLSWMITLLYAVRSDNFQQEYLQDPQPFTTEDDHPLPGAKVQANRHGKLFWQSIPAHQASPQERENYILHPLLADAIENLTHIICYELKRLESGAAGLPRLDELSTLSMLLFQISANNNDRNREFATRIDGNRVLWKGEEMIVTQGAINYSRRIHSFEES